MRRRHRRQLDRFILEMLGHPGADLYDRPLLEWANDPDLPMGVG